MALFLIRGYYLKSWRRSVIESVFGSIMVLVTGSFLRMFVVIILKSVSHHTIATSYNFAKYKRGGDKISVGQTM